MGLGEAGGWPVGGGRADRGHAHPRLADVTQAQLWPAAAGADRGGLGAALDGG